jgi:hypothetical protein
MHQLNVLICGPKNFISTLNELSAFLKFNLYEEFSVENNIDVKFDVIIFHKDTLNNEKDKLKLQKFKSVKILASPNDENKSTDFIHLKLPTTLNEINYIVEKSIIKKRFLVNSSINIKNYFLDKNEKKLLKDNQFIILTEKEIQLLELFIKYEKPVSKNKILSIVWNYSTDADTHTVETHIYRLRKKIDIKFGDNKFILNDKDGYFL